MKQAYSEAGRITSTHGVRGEVKIEVWLDTLEDLKRYRRIFIDGQERKLLSVRLQNRFVVAKLDQMDDVNAAQPFKGKHPASEVIPAIFFEFLGSVRNSIPAASASTAVVMMLASIPYSAPFRMLLPAVLTSKTAVTVSSFPLRLSPMMTKRM